MKPKILIEVRGGTVVSVSCDTQEGAEIYLVDYDNMSWDGESDYVEKDYSKDFPFELMIESLEGA